MELLWAVLLFEIGRLQTSFGLLLFSHLLLFWYWRHDMTKRQWSALWLAGFVLGAAVVFISFGWFGQIMDGVGYIHAHLYSGMWTNQEALPNMLLRWRTRLLPIYAPWLTIWLIGIIYIAKANHLPIFTQ